MLEELYLAGAEVLPREPLSRHTSLGIGGAARALLIPSSMRSLDKTLSILEREKAPYRIMGMGTNLLVSDEGIDDYVVKLERLTHYEVKGELIVVEAGLALKRLCEIALEEGLSGLEELYGIPGSVGGAVYMNAGAYGKEIKDVLEWVELWDGGEIVRVDAEDLGMGYRKSEVGSRIVLKAAFRLQKKSKESIENAMVHYLKRRLEKQPVFERSAGSVFKRPRPDFYVGSAIERLGLKGFKIGGVKISEKHAGFMVNDGGGTFEDAMRLIEEVKRRVKEAFGERLETEIVIWK